MNKIVATASSGVYLSFDGGANWKRVTGGALPETNFAGKYAEFRTAVWLADGSVEVSGDTGTYKFTP
jgi:hypothetical protein